MRVKSLQSCLRRQWYPTPVLLPGKSHGRRSLVGCGPWGREESDTTEWLHFHFSLSCIREGNGNRLQWACLENPRNRGAWWAAVYGVAQSWTRLKRLSSSSSSSSSHVWLCETLWTAACQAPQSMGFSRQEHWSGLLCPPPGDYPNPGFKPASLKSLASAGRFFTTSGTWEAHMPLHLMWVSCRCHADNFKKSILTAFFLISVFIHNVHIESAYWYDWINPISQAASYSFHSLFFFACFHFFLPSLGLIEHFIRFHFISSVDLWFTLLNKSLKKVVLQWLP